MKLSTLPHHFIALAFLLPPASCSVGTTDIVTIFSTPFGSVSKSTLGSTTHYLTVDQCATVTSTSTPYVTVQPVPQTTTSTTTQLATSTKTLPNSEFSTFTSTVRTYLSLSTALRKRKKMKKSHDKENVAQVMHREKFQFFQFSQEKALFLAIYADDARVSRFCLVLRRLGCCVECFWLLIGESLSIRSLGGAHTHHHLRQNEALYT